MAKEGTEPGGRRDGRARRYEHRREELLQAAMQHLLVHGPAKLTLRRIAETAGVTHASLLHHFKTREQLIIEMTERVLDQTYTSSALLNEYSPSTLTASGTLADLWLRMTGDPGGAHVRLSLAISGAALYDETVAAAIADLMRQRTDMLATAFIASGCPSTEASSLATGDLAILLGLAFDWMLTRDVDRIDAAYASFVASVEKRQQSWGPAAPAPLVA